jgi:hypothetical protein
MPRSTLCSTSWRSTASRRRTSTRSTSSYRMTRCRASIGTPWDHNIQYVLALTAYERFVGLDHFAPVWTSNPEITELSNRVTVRGNDDLQSRFPAMKGAIVTVVTSAGTFERLCAGPRGSPSGRFRAARSRTSSAASRTRCSLRRSRLSSGRPSRRCRSRSRPRR